MLPDTGSVESLPAVLLVVAPAISLLLTYVLVALGVRRWGPSRPKPAGVPGGEETPTGAPDESDSDAGVPGGTDAESDRVTCPDCGSENERGYRYCRSCVGELPGSKLPATKPSAPFLRGAN